MTIETTQTPKQGQRFKLPSGNVVEVWSDKITEALVPCEYLGDQTGGVAFTAEFLRLHGEPTQ